MEFYMCV